MSARPPSNAALPTAASASTDADRYCPHCQGEGYFVYDGGPGYYSTSYGTWLPSERYVACEACGGTGEIEPEEDEAWQARQRASMDPCLEVDESELPF